MPNFLTDDFNLVDITDQTKQQAFDITAVPTSTRRVAKYLGYDATLPFVGHGVANTAGEIEKINLTGQNTALAGQLLNPASLAGYYLVCYTVTCTTGDGTAGSIQFGVQYTDDAGATGQYGTALVLTIPGRDRGIFQVYQASGNMAYTTTLVGIAATSLYALRVRVMYLGP